MVKTYAKLYYKYSFILKLMVTQYTCPEVYVIFGQLKAIFFGRSLSDLGDPHKYDLVMPPSFVCSTLDIRWGIVFEYILCQMSVPKV